MEQRNKTINASTDEISFDLKKKFEQIKETKTTRVVDLVMRSCCGCGCHDVTVRRVVDFNSPLKNGDRISSSEVLRTDIIE